MMEWIIYVGIVILAASVSLGTFILLHRMGRVTGRFDRREKE